MLETKNAARQTRCHGRRMSREYISATTSVREVVNEVVHRDAICQRSPLLGILSFVGVLPRIAEIHVVADRHHQPVLVVVDAAPVWGLARLALLVSQTSLVILGARHLKALIQIVEDVKNR